MFLNVAPPTQSTIVRPVRHPAMTTMCNKMCVTMNKVIHTYIKINFINFFGDWSPSLIDSSFFFLLHSSPHHSTPGIYRIVQRFSPLGCTNTNVHRSGQLKIGHWESATPTPAELGQWHIFWRGMSSTLELQRNLVNTNESWHSRFQHQRKDTIERRTAI